MFAFKAMIAYIAIITWRTIAWAVVPFFLLFAKKTDQLTMHYGQVQVPRYVLPKWLKWAESPDEHLPGGLYEPTVLEMYNKFGWFITSWYWIGIRNVGNGIIWPLGHEVPWALKNMTPEDMETFNVFRKKKDILGIRFIWGWETVRDWHSTKTNAGYWAVPHATIRLAKQD